MSRNLSNAVEKFVTSVVVGKDLVPRLSVVNAGRLIDQMVSLLHFHDQLEQVYDVYVIFVLRLSAVKEGMPLDPKGKAQWHGDGS